MNLTSTDEYLRLRSQTTGFGSFSTENIKACENEVRSVQMKLDKAVANDDIPMIRWYIHLLSKKSKAVKILAVHRICETNKGKHTAGVDGVSIPHDKGQRLIMMESLLHEIDITAKPSPIKRVYIPKPNGKLRPLGIPTIRDRIVQDIIRQAIEPICEYHFQPCSYGFRPKRSCHDAIADLFIKLARKQSRRWIVEGDIKGCFDHIKHDHIISTLLEWHISKPITTIIEQMLKADIMRDLNLSPTDEGTPQGGVISPMLANVALTCLDNEVKQFGSQYKMNPIVRYADDFVIVAMSQKHGEEIKAYIGEYLKRQVNLELSDDKTHITEISEGFDFLGFNIRKYDDKLLIKPSKDKAQNIKRKIGDIYRQSKSDSVITLINRLNPVVKGWSNYYRYVVSRGAFLHIDRYMLERTIAWIQRQTNYGQGLKRYTNRKEARITLYDRETGYTLFNPAKIPIKRYIKIRSDMRVCDANAKEYWDKREYMNARDSVFESSNMSALFRRQKGKCEYCKQPITDEQVKDTTIQKHHMKPRSEGGDWKLGNLRLLHAECHRSLHELYSRKEMADLISKGIDYLRLMKPAKLG